MEMVDGATQIAYRLTVVPERIFDHSQARVPRRLIEIATLI
ncbi:MULTISPECIES: hypothetical protein [unclassified Bradyrhizobium]|nr:MULTISPECIES: hypothetical protein [unclassified Bradyrhizobium]